MTKLTPITPPVKRRVSFFEGHFIFSNSFFEVSKNLMRAIAKLFYHIIEMMNLFNGQSSRKIAPGYLVYLQNMLISLLFTNPVVFLTLALALMFSLSLHEFAHAYMALRQGDPTAKYAGRLTLNPLVHLDTFGTLFLLFAGFGWAKPVPINPRNFRDPKKGLSLVSIAGPGMNFILAITSCLLLKIPFFSGGLFSAFLYYFAFYNAGLGFFNLLPIAPLDGFKFVSGILPSNLSWQWEQLAPYGMFLLLILISTNAFSRILLPLMEGFLGLFGL